MPGVSQRQFVRAYINFDATAGTPVINSSYNVSSLTDNGAGDFTINFSAPLPNANYIINANCGKHAASGSAMVVQYGTLTVNSPPTTSGFRIQTTRTSDNTPQDTLYNSVMAVL